MCSTLIMRVEVWFPLCVPGHPEGDGWCDKGFAMVQGGFFAPGVVSAGKNQTQTHALLSEVSVKYPAGTSLSTLRKNSIGVKVQQIIFGHLYYLFLIWPLF